MLGATTGLLGREREVRTTMNEPDPDMELTCMFAALEWGE
jgi:hypothetical protein